MITFLIPTGNFDQETLRNNFMDVKEKEKVQ